MAVDIDSSSGSSVAFVRFLHCQVTLPAHPPFHTVLWRQSPCTDHAEVWGVRLPFLESKVAASINSSFSTHEVFFHLPRLWTYPIMYLYKYRLVGISWILWGITRTNLLCFITQIVHFGHWKLFRNESIRLKAKGERTANICCAFLTCL